MHGCILGCPEMSARLGCSSSPERWWRPVMAVQRMRLSALSLCMLARADTCFSSSHPSRLSSLRLVSPA